MGISREQALDCFASDDLIGIGMEADAVRRSLHPEGVVTYAIEHSLNPTLPLAHIQAAVDRALEQGATGMKLQGGSGLSLEAVEAILRAVRRQYPQMQLSGLSASEIVRLAATSDLSVGDVLLRMRDAGLDCLPAEGPGDWMEMHRAAHHVGLSSTASLTFGAGESMEKRVDLLTSLRSLQQETGGFNAFNLASHHPPGGRDLDDATAVEYLQTLAICRMVLDTIPNVQANWEQQGLKVLQMALRFGANDVGSIAGESSTAPEEEVRRIIRDAGFKPVQRDPLYRMHLLG